MSAKLTPVKEEEDEMADDAEEEEDDEDDDKLYGQGAKQVVIVKTFRKFLKRFLKGFGSGLGVYAGIKFVTALMRNPFRERYMF